MNEAPCYSLLLHSPASLRGSECATFTSAEILPLPPITLAAHKGTSWLMIEWPNFPRLKGGSERRGCLPSGWLFPSHVLLHYWIYCTTCITHCWRNKWGGFICRGQEMANWDADALCIMKQRFVQIGPICWISCSSWSLFVGFDDKHSDDPPYAPSSPHLKDFVTTWLRIQVSFVSTRPSIHPPCRLA